MWLSGCGRYAISRLLDQFQAFYFDGVGWGPVFERMADSLIEAKSRVEYHRFRRPLDRKAIA